jgi:hypothetical protein
MKQIQKAHKDEKLPKSSKLSKTSKKAPKISNYFINNIISSTATQPTP